MLLVFLQITRREKFFVKRRVGNVRDKVQIALGAGSILPLLVFLPVIGEEDRVSIFVCKSDDGDGSEVKEGLRGKEIVVGFAQISDESD